MTTPKPAQSVTTWIGLLETGQEEAAQRLWERYFPRLLEVARTRMRDMRRQVVDEEDIALSAFHSFCDAVSNGRIPQLQNRDDLWRTLVLITAGKVVDQRRRQESQKRGGEGIGKAADAGRRFEPDLTALEEIVGSEPDPAFAAEIADQLDWLLNKLPDPELREIAVCKLEGYSNEDISGRLKCSRRTVTRRLTVIRRTWEEAV